MTADDRHALIYYTGPATLADGDGAETELDATISLAVEPGPDGQPVRSWAVTGRICGGTAWTSSTLSGSQLRLPSGEEGRVIIADVRLQGDTTTLELIGQGPPPAREAHTS